MSKPHRYHMARAGALALAAGVALVAPAAMTTASSSAAVAAAKPDFPPLKDLVEKFKVEKVISTADGSKPYWELHKNDKTGKLLAILPSNYEGRLFMIAGTVSAGDQEAGVMGPTIYAEWRRYDKQLALVAPNLGIRTEGDQQAKDSVGQLDLGTVLFTVPIQSMQGPRPVIDLGKMAIDNAGKMFGFSPWGGYGPVVNRINPRLSKLTKAKAFPENVVFEYEVPEAPSGNLVRLTWSIGALEGDRGFKPRKADSRVGYFYDFYQDFAKPANEDVTDRYITRWNVEKADKRLDLSPPKEPIVWYIEHTTPIKFRRWVREGILAWNDSFRKIGIDGALEVRQQDAASGAYMDIDPEDARYNFFRWNASNQGYAIGPSRTNPRTGQILDADVVWNQGLTRAVRSMLGNLADEFTEQAFGPETLAFFDDHPDWDPRVRLATPMAREQKIRARALEAGKAVEMEVTDERHPWAGVFARPENHACKIGNMLALDINIADSAFAAGLLALDKSKDKEIQLLDGLPEDFIGPMIRYISAHEVGHCLGLQHNMAASTIRTLEEINSPGFEGPTIGSVMDYAAANINFELGEVQGPYASPELGPYDHWAIAYGYGPEKELDEVLSRVSEPDNIFISQTAMSFGNDPRNNTWELGKDNLNFAESRLGLVKDLRGRLLTDIVDDGEPWAEARRRFDSLYGTHIQSLFIAGRWIGGSYINNDFKGDPGDRPAIGDVEPEQQRRALGIILDNAFEDEAYGLTPELVRFLGKEYWWDPQGINELTDAASYTVYDQVGGIQATALSLLMNPTSLRRVYDNEFRVESGSDAFTLAELLKAVNDNVWRELSGRRGEEISGFRRNLQREHTERLITLALLDRTSSPSMRTISSLARQYLRSNQELVQRAQSADSYTAAHLTDINERIERALDASYTVRR
ncbi:MAG: zinc-dependent metalloprotease [Planctomycetota bacterium]